MYRWVTRISYHAILEDNVFKNTAGCGINVTGRLGVREGPVAFDVLLRRNVIRNCDVGVDVFYRDAAGRGTKRISGGLKSSPTASSA